MPQPSRTLGVEYVEPRPFSGEGFVGNHPEAFRRMLAMMGVAEAIGWGLLGSEVQGGIIALSVWLALKIVPLECAALRHRIALGGLVILLLAFIATEGLMLSDWRTHVARWRGAESRRGFAPFCPPED